MITVLHLITSLNTGGAETMLYRLTTRSDRARFRHVVVALLDEGPLGAKLTAQGVPVYTLGVRRGVPNPLVVLRLLTLLRRISPHVVQTWLYHADMLGTVGGLIARVPVVWNIRSSFHHGLHSLPATICVRLSRLPRAIIVNSADGRATHTRLGYRPQAWRLIPNGFDLQEFQPDRQARAAVREELGLAPETLLVGLIARFDPLKDHQMFLQAASIVSQTEPELHFLLAGRDITWDNPALAQLIDGVGLRDRVHLLGERHDIPRLNAALDVATLSSYGEAFPNVVGEAMACGVPCVVTDVGDAALIAGATGRVVPPRNPEAFATALRELLRLRPEERVALGQRARHRIETDFALDRVVRQYETVYEQVAR